MLISGFQLGDLTIGCLTQDMKNAINNINTYGITADEIGKGLEYNTFDKKLNVNVKDNSSLIINEDNKNDLIWK